jgi:hypothetical protein
MSLVNAGTQGIDPGQVTRDAIKQGSGFEVLAKPYTDQMLARKVRQILNG